MADNIALHQIWRRDFAAMPSIWSVLAVSALAAFRGREWLGRQTGELIVTWQ
jgi:hypothetical protein